MNKKGWSKKKINGADKAKFLHANLGYISVEDFRWIVKSQQIVDRPMNAQDIDISHAI